MTMKWDMGTFADRSRYRPASIALLLASSLPLAGIFVGVPDWLCFLASFPAYIVLTVITYRRLRNGAFSGGWVALMILQIGIGPTWHLSAHVAVSLVGCIVGCVPVIMGWLVPAKFEASL